MQHRSADVYPHHERAVTRLGPILLVAASTLVGPAAQASCDLDVVEFLGALSAARTALDNDYVDGAVEIVDDIDRRYRCFVFAPPPLVLAQWQHIVASTRHTTEGDWEAPLRHAVSLDPLTVTSLPPGELPPHHDFRHFTVDTEAPPVVISLKRNLVDRAQVYVDGVHHREGPISVQPGLHLVQVRRGAWWDTEMVDVLESTTLDLRVPRTQPQGTTARVEAWAVGGVGGGDRQYYRGGSLNAELVTDYDDVPFWEADRNAPWAGANGIGVSIDVDIGLFIGIRSRLVLANTPRMGDFFFDSIPFEVDAETFQEGSHVTAIDVFMPSYAVAGLVLPMDGGTRNRPGIGFGLLTDQMWGGYRDENTVSALRDRYWSTVRIPLALWLERGREVRTDIMAMAAWPQVAGIAVNENPVALVQAGVRPRKRGVDYRIGVVAGLRWHRRRDLDPNGFWVDPPEAAIEWSDHLGSALFLERTWHAGVQVSVPLLSGRLSRPEGEQRSVRSQPRR